MSAVVVNDGLYKGCPARVVEEHTSPTTGRKTVLVEFVSGYRVRYDADEVTPIPEIGL